MSERPRGEPSNDRERAEKTIRLGFAEEIELDVSFCDLVPGRSAQEGLSLRFRGYRAGTAEMVKLYCDLDMIEGALIQKGLLQEPVRRDAHARVEVSLSHHAITIGRERRGGGGGWSYVVTVRNDRDVKQWVQAIEDVHAKVVPTMASRGYAVGGPEVTQIASDLVRRRRQQP